MPQRLTKSSIYSRMSGLASFNLKTIEDTGKGEGIANMAFLQLGGGGKVDSQQNDRKNQAKMSNEHGMEMTVQNHRPKSKYKVRESNTGRISQSNPEPELKNDLLNGNLYPSRWAGKAQ
ncbi:hypothetical protein Tco_0733304 [Tanacetum coccineum]